MFLPCERGLIPTRHVVVRKQARNLKTISGGYTVGFGRSAGG